jgi:hypothetical protein
MKMGLDVATRNLLEKDTAYSKAHSAHWQSLNRWGTVWSTILISLFPLSQGYTVGPRKRAEHHSDFIFEVCKVIFTPGPLPGPPEMESKTVLIVVVKDPQQWDHGKELLLEQVGHRMNLALDPRTDGKWFWVGSIGPHWVYGEQEYGQEAKPLIEWHDATFDDSSCRDLDQLVELVCTL